MILDVESKQQIWTDGSSDGLYHDVYIPESEHDKAIGVSPASDVSVEEPKSSFYSCHILLEDSERGWGNADCQCGGTLADSKPIEV